MRSFMDAITEWTPSDVRHMVRTDWDNAGGPFDYANENIERWMREKGFKPLGEGGYGIVFSDGRSRVVAKIMREDPCWMAFAEYCRKNRSNPHLPKIGKTMPVSKMGVYVTFIEALDPLPPEKYDFDLKAFLNLRIRYRIPSMAAYPIGRIKLAASEFETNHPLLAETLEEVTKLGTNCAVDLHDENFMMRGNTIVIIDPLA